MSKKKWIVSIVVLVVLIIIFSTISNKPKEFDVEDVMFDRTESI